MKNIGNNNQLCVNDLNAGSLNRDFVNVGKDLSSVLPTRVKPKNKIRSKNKYPFSLEKQNLLKLQDVLVA